MATSFSGASAPPPCAICDCRRSRSAAFRRAWRRRSRAPPCALAKACASSRSSASARATWRRSAASARAPRPCSASSSRRVSSRAAVPSAACREADARSASTVARRSLVSSKSRLKRERLGVARREPRRHLGSAHLGIRLLDLALRLQLAELGEPRLPHPNRCGRSCSSRSRWVSRSALSAAFST